MLTFFCQKLQFHKKKTVSALVAHRKNVSRNTKDKHKFSHGLANSQCTNKSYYQVYNIPCYLI